MDWYINNSNANVKIKIFGEFNASLKNQEPPQLEYIQDTTHYSLACTATRKDSAGITIFNILGANSTNSKSLNLMLKGTDISTSAYRCIDLGSDDYKKAIYKINTGLTTTTYNCDGNNFTDGYISISSITTDSIAGEFELLLQNTKNSSLNTLTISSGTFKSKITVINK